MATLGRYELRIKRVLEHIEANLDGALSLDELAEVAALSRFHFHRVFRAVQGETVAQAVRRLRMVSAAKMLSNSDLSLTQIAQQCGYPNHQSFSHVFRSFYNVSPGLFRQNGTLVFPKIPKGQQIIFNVEIENLPETLAATLAHYGPYENIEETFKKLEKIITDNGLMDKVHDVFGVYCDDPESTPSQQLRSYVGVTFSSETIIPKELEQSYSDGGRVAALSYKGSYMDVGQAYQYLYGPWLNKSNEELRDAPAYEIYTHWMKDSKTDEIEAKVCLPLAR